MNITQSAVSHQIKLLESFYALKLFERERAVSLTPHGALLHDAVLKSFAHLADVSDRLHMLNKKRPLVVATIASFEPWLADHLSFYQEDGENPQVDIRTYSWLDTFPQNQDIDLAVLFTREDFSQPGIQLERLFAEDAVPVCKKSLMNSTPGVHTIDDLYENWLLHKRNRAQWKMWFHAMGTPYPHRNMERFFRDSSALNRALHMGEGIALIPENEIEGDLAEPLSAKIPDSYAYHLCWKEERGDHPFKDWLIREVSAKRYADEVPEASHRLRAQPLFQSL